MARNQNSKTDDQKKRSLRNNGNGRSGVRTTTESPRMIFKTPAIVEDFLSRAQTGHSGRDYLHGENVPPPTLRRSGGRPIVEELWDGLFRNTPMQLVRPKFGNPPPTDPNIPEGRTRIFPDWKLPDEKILGQEVPLFPDLTLPANWKKDFLRWITGGRGEGAKGPYDPLQQHGPSPSLRVAPKELDPRNDPRRPAAAFPPSDEKTPLARGIYHPPDIHDGRPIFNPNLIIEGEEPNLRGDVPPSAPQPSKTVAGGAIPVGEFLGDWKMAEMAGFFTEEGYPDVEGYKAFRDAAQAGTLRSPGDVEQYKRDVAAGNQFVQSRWRGRAPRGGAPGGGAPAVDKDRWQRVYKHLDLRARIEANPAQEWETAEEYRMRVAPEATYDAFTDAKTLESLPPEPDTGVADRREFYGDVLSGPLDTSTRVALTGMQPGETVLIDPANPGVTNEQLHNMRKMGIDIRYKGTFRSEEARELGPRGENLAYGGKGFGRRTLRGRGIHEMQSLANRLGIDLEDAAPEDRATAGQKLRDYAWAEEKFSKALKAGISPQDLREIQQESIRSISDPKRPTQSMRSLVDKEIRRRSSGARISFDPDRAQLAFDRVKASSENLQDMRGNIADIGPDAYNAAVLAHNTLQKELFTPLGEKWVPVKPLDDFLKKKILQEKRQEYIEKKSRQWDVAYENIHNFNADEGPPQDIEARIKRLNKLGRELVQLEGGKYIEVTLEGLLEGDRAQGPVATPAP